jgi:hypothetical protein
VVEPQFQSAAEFHESLARVYVWSNVVCSEGKFTNDDAPLHAFHLREEYPADIPDCFPQDGRFGFIDKTGRAVIPPQFVDAQNFAEELAAVVQAGINQYGYIDRTEQTVVQPRFNQAGPFSEGLAAVETRSRVVGDQVVDIAWGFIDKTEALRIPDKYEFAGNFSEGLARVTIKSGVSNGYIDHSGKMVIPARFTEAWDFSEGLAVVCSDECIYINRSGKAVLKKYYASWPFSDGLTVIARPPIDYDDPKYYIDKKGRVIAPYSIYK